VWRRSNRPAHHADRCELLKGEVLVLDEVAVSSRIPKHHRDSAQHRESALVDASPCLLPRTPLDAISRLTAQAA
jgi:hypothetical protein